MVLRISYFEENEAYIQQLVRQAYLSNPATALDFPDAQVAMYPESGQQRIVEVTLTYHQSLQTLESWRNSLSREAERICQPLTELTIKEKLDGLPVPCNPWGRILPKGEALLMTPCWAEAETARAWRWP